MITIILKTGKTERFNLKNREREKALRDAWYAMNDIPTCAHKVFDIHTDQGNKLLIPVRDIETIKFEDSEYIKISASDVH